jgi:hypothetical protein
MTASKPMQIPNGNEQSTLQQKQNMNIASHETGTKMHTAQCTGHKCQYYLKPKEERKMSMAQSKATGDNLME